MRQTIGRYVRRYLYDKRLGNRRVSAIYRDDVKIWPTLSDTVYSCVLDVNKVVGSVDWAYWLHALDAVAQLGVSAECYVKLTAGGREYMLGSTFGAWYVAEYDGAATVVFGDNGPLMSKLRIGDEVTVQLRVPARKSAEFEGQAVCRLPYLTNTQFRVRWGKLKKKVWAARRFSVIGQPGGVVHYGGNCQTNAHERGWFTRILPGNTHKWFNRVYNNTMFAGERELAIDTAALGSGGGGGVTLLWPGFMTTLKFTVSAVVHHD